MKSIFLLGAAALIPTSALAQQAPVSTQTAPAPAASAPVTSAPTQNAPAGTAAGDVATTEAAPTQTAPAETAAQPTASGDQVAAVIDKEFAAYDKDANGALNQAEFGDWMVKLKSVSDPSTKADAPSTKTWVNAAFAQADTDKSKSLTKTELTGFLSQGQS